MIRAGNRAGARRQRIAFRDSCESPICIRRGVSPQLLHSRLTVLVATATHSRLEPLTTDIDPCLFAQWVFPRLLASRRPRYEAIAEHGYIVNAREVAGVSGEDDFLRLVGNAIDRKASVLDEGAGCLSAQIEARRES